MNLPLFIIFIGRINRNLSILRLADGAAAARATTNSLKLRELRVTLRFGHYLLMDLFLFVPLFFNQLFDSNVFLSRHLHVLLRIYLSLHFFSFFRSTLLLIVWVCESEIRLSVDIRLPYRVMCHYFWAESWIFLVFCQLIHNYQVILFQLYPHILYLPNS